ncbi:MAG: competence/damage-inducible protein A [Ectothiorhodospiraceae bacterium]|nr:competence/damage-inducible protein A [Chromatiales bacterium]MCP5157292.1 competence/damage-inducible protein A [Ectothiorhodospiraceae bacterium]
MPFGIVVIGSELLSGKRRDGHLAFTIEALARRGLELDWCHYLGDDPRRLIEELARARAGGDVVFSFGGIGATPDDHTRAAAAAATGVALAPHPEAVAIIEGRFGAGAYPHRIHMAHLPVGATLIPNPVNQIPGFSLGHLHFVPGFPQMAHPMVEWVLDTGYRDRFDTDGPVETLLRLPGTSEGQLIDIMERLLAEHATIRLSCLPHMDGDYRETELGLRGRRGDVEPAVAWLEAALDAAGLDWHRARTDG